VELLELVVKVFERDSPILLASVVVEEAAAAAAIRAIVSLCHCSISLMAIEVDYYYC
jgi:hypothetical protein